MKGVPAATERDGNLPEFCYMRPLDTLTKDERDESVRQATFICESLREAGFTVEHRMIATIAKACIHLAAGGWERNAVGVARRTDNSLTARDIVLTALCTLALAGIFIMAWRVALGVAWLIE